MKSLLISPVHVSIELASARLSVSDNALTAAYGDFSDSTMKYAWRDYAVEIRDKRQAVIKAGFEYILATHRLRGEAPEEFAALNQAINTRATLVITDREPTYSGAPIGERVDVELTDCQSDADPIAALVQRKLSVPTSMEGAGKWLSSPCLQLERQLLCVTTKDEPIILRSQELSPFSSEYLRSLGCVEAYGG